MNKSQLIEALSHGFEGNKKSAQQALESILETITREVAKGEKVAITGFGAFEKAVRPSRMVRNPRTGERTRAKKTAVPKFRAGADFKAVVSGAKKPKPAASTAVKSTSRATKTTPAKKSTTGSTKKAAAKSLAKKSSTPATKKAAAKKLSTSSPARKTTAAKKTTGSTTTKKTAAKTLAKRSSSTATKKAAAKKLAKKSTAKRTTARKS